MYPLRRLVLCFGGDGQGYGNGDGGMPTYPLTSDLGGAEPVELQVLPCDALVLTQGEWPWRAAQSGATGSVLTGTLRASQRPANATLPAA